MFAVVKIGNQQFKVKAGDFIRAPYQKCSPGDKIDIPVLAFGTEKDMICDSSQLKKSKVKALMLRQSLANKIIVFKKKRRKGYRRTQGHRQKIIELRILELYSPEGKVEKVEHKKTAKPAGTEDKKAKKSAVSKSSAPAKPAKASHKKVKKQAMRASAKQTEPQKPVKTMKKPAVKVAKAQKPAETKTAVKTAKPEQAKKGD